MSRPTAGRRAVRDDAIARAEAAASDRDIDDVLSDENLDAHRISASIAAAIRRLCADRNQLRARIAELGEIREEWGYTYRNHLDEIEGEYWDEATARRCANTGDHIMHRFIGRWREVDDSADGSHG